MEHFNFLEFKAVMGISNINEATYSLIFRAIFDILNTQYSIDLDTTDSVTNDFVWAVYRHAKYIYDYNDKNLDIVDSVSDSSGNKSTYSTKVPSDVAAIYKMYSPNAIVLI